MKEKDRESERDKEEATIGDEGERQRLIKQPWYPFVLGPNPLRETARKQHIRVSNLARTDSHCPCRRLIAGGIIDVSLPGT